MIRLRKHSIPKAVAQKIEERTQRYLKLLEDGSAVPDALAAAYRDPDIKSLLKAETADKCAYCESKVPHVDYGDVEHIVPKSVRPDLRFAYENLTFACGICNTKKGEYHSDECPLLNPFVDDPSEHLIAAGPMVLRTPTSDRGMVTEKRLDLNRAGLIERRKERIEGVAALIDQIARTRSQAIRDVLLAQVDNECRDEREFAFVIRAYVAAVLALSA
jgi:5-methylcytosine-specific restriction endonuclease McrA